MFKIEELKKEEAFKELDDSVLKKFVELSQTAGDNVKAKYEAKEQELNDKLEGVSKELEDLQEANNKNDNDNEGGKDMSDIEKMLETLQGKINGLENEKANADIRAQVLARAKEENRDIQKTQAYINRLGENLTVDESLELIPVVEENNQSDPSSIEGDDDDDVYVSVGNSDFDDIVNG